VVSVLATSLLTAIIGANVNSKDTIISIKPSISAIEEFSHVDKLLSLEPKLKDKQAASQEEIAVTLREQLSYLRSLDTNSLIESIGELSFYDEANFERYQETIGAILMEKWENILPSLV